jgi:predicted TIM-barrel fold metal-dependent hydrolase
MRRFLYFGISFIFCNVALSFAKAESLVVQGVQRNLPVLGRQQLLGHQLNLNNPPARQEIKKSLIDIHTHIMCEKKTNACFLNDKFKKHWKYKIYLKAFDITKREIDEKGDDVFAHRLSELIRESQFVSKAVVLPIDGYYDKNGVLNLTKTQVMVGNKFVLEQTKKFNNLLYAASVNPYRIDALNELTKAKADGALFVKWIPCIMGIDPASDDPQLKSFYQKLVELKLPLLSHTGEEHSFIDSDDKLCDPQKLKKPLSMGVEVIAAHLGTIGKYEGEESFDRMTRLIKEFPNLKFDISSLVSINKFNHIPFALKYQSRYYYGSDYPLINSSLMGFPINRKTFAWLKIGRVWGDFIETFSNVFDKDVALKLALGVPMRDLEKSHELLPK